MITFFIVIILLLIYNHQLIVTGATEGLMLWYKNVLPLLLPFILISNLLEQSVLKQPKTGSKKCGHAVITVLILGLFCGYPIGAKSNAFFVEKHIIDRGLGNIILPICNNVSPMFLMGFVLSNTLNNSISLWICYYSIYLPYLLVFAIELMIYENFLKKATHTLTSNSTVTLINTTSNTNISQDSINQITHIGLYIMICSIISEFVLSINFLPDMVKIVLSGIVEITRGITHINSTSNISIQIKTALIIACTSFGGISSIMQTSKVIQASGLSLIHYILIKALCSTGTFLLCLLII